MPRPRSELLGSLGKLFSIFKKVADKVMELGGSDEDITKIDMEDNLTTNLAHVVIGNVARGGSLLAIRNPLDGRIISIGDLVTLKLGTELDGRMAVVVMIYPKGDRMLVAFADPNQNTNKSFGGLRKTHLSFNEIEP